ncbi:hypothetical protein AgCh_005823 [Apium graveolens]
MLQGPWPAFLADLCARDTNLMSSILNYIVSKVAASQRQFGPDGDALTPSLEVRAGALAIFAVLGIPFIHMLTTIFWFLNYSIQVTYSIPFALASIFSAGSKAGKGFWPFNLVRKKLQLVGITALLLACKYEEVAVPVVEDLIVISDRAYNIIEVLEMDGISVLSFIARAKSCSRNPNLEFCPGTAARFTSAARLRGRADIRLLWHGRALAQPGRAGLLEKLKLPSFLAAMKWSSRAFIPWTPS